MLIEFIAHATFKITLDDNRVIIVDPYQAFAFDGRFNYPPYEASCDMVCITHDHIDHSYVHDLNGDFLVVRDSYEDETLKIYSVRACHDTEGGTKFGGYIDMKIIEHQGVRVCHAGDLGELLAEQQLKEIGILDVFIAPVGGFYTMDAEMALENARRINPKVLIPCHYKTDLCTLKLNTLSSFLSLTPSYQTLDKWCTKDNTSTGVIVLRPLYGEPHEV